jgi:hypothetical protein
MLGLVRKAIHTHLENDYLVHDLIADNLDDMLASDTALVGRIRAVIREELDTLLVDRNLVREHLLNKLNLS